MPIDVSELRFNEARLRELPDEAHSVHVLQFLVSLEHRIRTFSREDAIFAQPVIERELLTLISLPSPRPSAPIRRVISRCYVRMFKIGDSKTLGDTVTLLLSLIKSSKGAEGRDTRL